MNYFDYNGTTPLHPAAKQAWLEAYDHAWMNPSSLSREGARVHVLLGEARERLASLLGAASNNIVFTSGATEANNALMRYMGNKLGRQARVAVSSVEHPSIKEAARIFFKDRVFYIPVSKEGQLDLEALEDQLCRGRIAFVSVMALNNETGVLYPWERVQKLCRQYGVKYHSDASQWLGKLSSEGLGGCDFITGCAHKFGGPKGIGFLKFHPECNDLELQHGGAQENGYRAGTEDYPSIVAMVKALEVRNRHVGTYQSMREPWRLAFEHELLAHIPGLEIVGQKVPRVWNTVNLIFPKYRSCDWVALLERRGFVVAMRSACSTEKDVTKASVLGAMGYDANALMRAIRISGGWDTCRQDWLFLAETIIQGWRLLCQEALLSQVISL